MTDPALLAILKCPLTGQRLREASAQWVEAINTAIGNGRLYDVGQRPVETPVDGALIVEDESLLYPIRDGIPTLIPDWGIRSGELSVGRQPPQGE